MTGTPLLAFRLARVLVWGAGVFSSHKYKGQLVLHHEHLLHPWLVVLLGIPNVQRGSEDRLS